jgi:hypothetical protein
MASRPRAPHGDAADCAARRGQLLAGGAPKAKRNDRTCWTTIGTSDLEEERCAVRLAPYVKFREEKFGGVLFETRSEKVYTLNPTGAAVIREIASGDEAAIAAKLKDRFADQSGAIEREVGAFIAELRQRGLLEA